MINMRTKMSFKTESGNILDKLRARSIELRKNQKNINGGNNVQPKILSLPKGLQQLQQP